MANNQEIEKGLKALGDTYLRGEKAIEALGDVYLDDYKSCTTLSIEIFEGKHDDRLDEFLTHKRLLIRGAAKTRLEDLQYERSK